MSFDRRDGKPLIDLAAIAVSPALIMGMVGSLVWFLVDVVYSGKYPDRLLWCLSFFIFGIVLIARISIEMGRAKAAAYGAALGGVTFLAMLRYVQYSDGDTDAVAFVIGWATSVGMMALVWWLAHKLTWDCTHLDEDRRASGRGLLVAAGLERSTTPDASADDDEDPEEAAKPRKKDSPGLMGWMERLWRYQEARRKKPHTPGTWVLYFGLAALPVFALGQSLIPSDDLDRRRTTLIEAAIFVGCGLGLLVTTSLMGLRRYLEQRDARISPMMTLAWLGLGGGLIALFLAVAVLLPRPHSETAFIKWDRTPPKGEVDASKNAQKSGSGGKGEGSEGGQPNNENKGNEQKGGGEKGQPSGNQGGSEPGKEKGGEKSGQNSGEKKNEQGDAEKGEKKNPWTGQKSGESQKSEEKSESETMKAINKTLETAGTALKWLVWVLLALAVLAGVVYFLLKGLAPFTAWARGLLDWFRGLFARRESLSAAATEADAEPSGPTRPPTFAEFSNPFTDGTARGRKLAELTAYTFAALDSWAWDHDAGRSPEETPGEFAARLEGEFPQLDGPAGRVADLLAQSLYSRSGLPSDAAKALAALWQRMESSSPLPAGPRARR